MKAPSKTKFGLRKHPSPPIADENSITDTSLKNTVIKSLVNVAPFQLVILDETVAIGKDKSIVCFCPFGNALFSLIVIAFSALLGSTIGSPSTAVIG